jgi:hypothetical protein
VSSYDADIKTLAVLNSDNSVVTMIANHAVNASNDNDGPGISKTVSVDVSALGSFSSGSLLTIGKSTSVTTGPIATPVTPAAAMSITLDGYSVADSDAETVNYWRKRLFRALTSKFVLSTRPSPSNRSAARDTVVGHSVQAYGETI